MFGFALIALVSVQAVHMLALKGCNSAADCGTTECCRANVLPRGKRQLGMTSGTCRPQGVEKNSCYVNAASWARTSLGTVWGCPCQRGLTCRGMGMSEVPLGEVGRCTAPKVSVSGTCSSGSDCLADQCCVANAQVKGKRQLAAGGKCQSLRTKGQGCYDRLSRTSGKPSGVVLQCPCVTGLSCTTSASSSYVVPYGRLGRCM